MCPRRQTQTRDLPPLCARLDSPVAAPLPGNPASLGTFWVTDNWFTQHPKSLWVAGIQNSSPAQGMLPGITDPDRDRKDKANRANSATPWEHMFFSEPCTQLGDWFLCTISLDWKEPYWHFSTHTEQCNTFFSPPSPLFCCRSITWFFQRSGLSKYTEGCYPHSQHVIPNPSTPTTKERPIMIYSLKHRAKMRALLENKKWEELLSKQSTAPTSPGYFVLNLFNVLKSLLKGTPWIS